MRTFLALFTMFVVVACTSEEEAARQAELQHKASIRHLIAEFDRDGADLRHHIAKVEYDGKPAYLISSPCCDMFNYLYDPDGNVLCAPSGGFAGAGDGPCVHKLEGGKDRGPACPASAASR